MIRHHFTVDVEEYFQVTAFETCVPRADWDRLESRVEANVSRLLDLLSRGGAFGTFFILGWIAKRHPRVVEAIAREGHEVASHGWGHRRVTTLTPEEFRSSVRRSKRILEEISGQRVVGYRAPSFSIVPGLEWALDILIEEGYRYDSTLFPVRRPGYGFPNGDRDPHWIERPAGRLAEVPPATLKVAGVNLPAAGGAYLRLFPYALVRAALAEHERRGTPGTFYTHPWEIDPGQPRIRAPLLARVRTYTGLQRTAPRLQRLLGEFRFTTIASTVETL